MKRRRQGRGFCVHCSGLGLPIRLAPLVELPSAVRLPAPPTPLEAARARTREAVARHEAAVQARRQAQAEELATRAALAEARRGEWAERAGQPIALGDAIAAVLRAGVLGLVVGVALAGDPEPTRRRWRR